jgi:DNA-binding MarR family transcriptional regulator
LSILRLLKTGEKSVGEIVEALGCTQPRISNHLACLRWCNFVQTRQSGTQIFYSLQDERVIAILNLAESFLSSNAAQVYSCTRVDDERSQGEEVPMAAPEALVPASDLPGAARSAKKAAVV